ncbi:MAG: ABC transporter permease [Firmicutes bacterium]|nr:ABC transporter permease [Bacillota bacterium]
MKALFYPRLAWTGIKNNRRLYLPYILTCIGMVAMFYIMLSLSTGEFLDKMRGGTTLGSVLGLGAGVIGFFAVLFLFYTNSFLIRRRKKEFGLYNILGMGKRNIARVLFSETLILAAVSLVFGLILGAALSKLAELGLAYFVESDADYDFTVYPTAMGYTVLLFVCIFLLLFFKSVGQVGLSNPVELLHSESVGEKPPKANWVFGVLGIVILAAAYYISVTIEQPVAALGWFFIAVLMVIAATYLLFIAGSVLLCRILQKNKRYYYKPNHFVSVSSMAYRMKRNGAGLASVCILITMVLVMIASTSCLYFGKNDVLRSQYPHDFNSTVDFDTLDEVTQENIDKTKAAIDAFMDKNGGISFGICGKSDRVTGELSDGVFYMGDDVYDPEHSTFLYIIDLADYNRNTGSSYRLNDGEALVFASSRTYDHDTIRIEGGREYKVVKSDGTIDFIRDTDMLGFSAVYIVVPDFYSSAEDLLQATEKQGVSQPWLQWRYQFDSPADYLTQLEIEEGIWDVIAQAHSGGYGLSSLAGARDDFYSSFGGLFFLGIMLSIVFIIAAVLIIYYKQVSEGYEDQSRFEIMQKVGMTKKDIRKSINSQMLTVFFLPLLFAIVHLGFAFPMINKLLLLFGLDNLGLLLLTAAISALVFALFYIIVYRVTSNAYYSIVSGAKE